MTIDQIRASLADRRLSVVSGRTGLSIPTIRSFRDGETAPHPATVEALRRYLAGAQNDTDQ